MFTFAQFITVNTRMSIMQLCTWILHWHLVPVLKLHEISCLLWLELVELDRNNLRFKRDWRFTRLQQTLERTWYSTWCVLTDVMQHVMQHVMRTWWALTYDSKSPKGSVACTRVATIPSTKHYTPFNYYNTNFLNLTNNIITFMMRTFWEDKCNNAVFLQLIPMVTTADTDF